MRGKAAPPHGGREAPVAGLRAALREFAFGMTGYEFARHAMETRTTLENLFMVVLVGDMIGLPVIPPYYSLGLLPFVTPGVTSWKRRVLRERDLTEMHYHHLHGV
ncbi:MAG: hypothetical protein IVW52_15905 [Acidimicrobiales bacterium]|nr:hypothetical protein [Acidimicrobiales bacterium]